MFWLIVTTALADNWGTPRSHVQYSMSGEHVLHVDPVGEWPNLRTRMRMTDAGGAVAYDVFAVNGDGMVHAWVSDGGVVVTSGEHGRAGYEHALVIYDPSGHVVVDLHLDEVVTPTELFTRVRHSASSRWWIERHDASFADGHILLTTDWGEAIQFRLEDGQQFRDGHPVHIPSRGEALAWWLSDPSALTALEIDISSSVIGRRDRTIRSAGCEVTETESDCTLRKNLRPKVWPWRRHRTRRLSHDPDAFMRVASLLVALQPYVVDRYSRLDVHNALVRVQVQPAGIPGASANDRLSYGAMVTEATLRRDETLRVALTELYALAHIPQWPEPEP